MVLWAANFIVVKSALEVLPPVGFTFLRFVLASLTLFALLRWREGSVGLPRRDLLPICGLGALGFGLYQILWTTGLTTVPAGDSALIIASTPVLVAFLAVAARSDVLTPAKVVGGVDLVRRGRDRHRDRPGPDPRQLDRRRGDHAPRRVLLVRLPGVRRAVPRPLQPASGRPRGRRSPGPSCSPRWRSASSSAAGSSSIPPDVIGAVAVLGLPCRGRLERRRPERGQGHRPDPDRRVPVPRSGARRRPRRDLPLRADPPRPDRRRDRDRRRRPDHPRQHRSPPRPELTLAPRLSRAI